MARLNMTIQLSELSNVLTTDLSTVLTKLLEYAINGANAQLKDQNTWFTKICLVEPFCTGSDPYQVKLNLEVEVIDTCSLEHVSGIVADIVEEHWKFNIDEMQRKAPPYWS